MATYDYQPGLCLLAGVSVLDDHLTTRGLSVDEAHWRDRELGGVGPCNGLPVEKVLEMSASVWAFEADYRLHRNVPLRLGLKKEGAAGRFGQRASEAKVRAFGKSAMQGRRAAGG